MKARGVGKLLQMIAIVAKPRNTEMKNIRIQKLGILFIPKTQTIYVDEGEKEVNFCK